MKAHKTNKQKWDLIIKQKSPQNKKWLKTDFIVSKDIDWIFQNCALKFQLN